MMMNNVQTRARNFRRISSELQESDNVVCFFKDPWTWKKYKAPREKDRDDDDYVDIGNGGCYGG